MAVLHPRTKLAGVAVSAQGAVALPAWWSPLSGRGNEGGFLNLVDRPLLVAVLDPARAAAGAKSDRVQTEGDGDKGRSAQRAAWHEKPLVVSLAAVGWLHGRAAGALSALVLKAWPERGVA